MISSLLALNIIEGPLILTSYVLSAVCAVALLLGRTGRLTVLSAFAGVAGAFVGALALLVSERFMHAFGGPLGWPVRFWVIAFFAGLGVCVAGLRRSSPWRKALACAAALSFAVTATLGVNAYYGLHPTLASFLGISLAPRVELDTIKPHAAAQHHVPLWESWKPPAQLPPEGTTAQVVIPPQSSGFTSRPAGLYLPPAAQVPTAGASAGGLDDGTTRESGPAICRNGAE